MTMHLSTRILLFFVFLFAYAATHAQIHTQKSICNETRASIERLGELRDQGIAGLCFTYEGADLITYQLGQRVSAIDLAVSYFKPTRMKKMTSLYKSGGDTASSLMAALKIGGVCSEVQMPSDEVFLNDDDNPQIYGAFKWLEQHSWDHPQTMSFLQIIFPNLTYELFQQSLNFETFKDRILYLQKFACGERLSFSHLKLNYFEADKKNTVPKLIVKINQQLQKNNIIGIGFRSNDLYEEQESLDDENHATTLVGRRWNEAKNTCEYLMRDNFGKQCNLYQNHFDCENGYIWLDEKFLLKNLYEIEYF